MTIKFAKVRRRSSIYKYNRIAFLFNWVIKFLKDVVMCIPTGLSAKLCNHVIVCIE
jgi:hypothetical protein